MPGMGGGKAVYRPRASQSAGGAHPLASSDSLRPRRTDQMRDRGLMKSINQLIMRQSALRGCCRANLGTAALTGLAESMDLIHESRAIDRVGAGGGPGRPLQL